MNCRGLKTLLNVARKQLVIEKRAKKPGISRVFANTKNVKINALRIVDAYALCVDQLSYVQRDVRHE
jgi:3-deoxy-D-manno-octulosonate 8-phosphate phosphatase KdsC-like HAD superfamily phosphatase